MMKTCSWTSAVRNEELTLHIERNVTENQICLKFSSVRLTSASFNLISSGYWTCFLMHRWINIKFIWQEKFICFESLQNHLNLSFQIQILRQSGYKLFKVTTVYFYSVSYANEFMLFDALRHVRIHDNSCTLTIKRYHWFN